MEEINVTCGCSPNNEKHCSDGDSCYLNGEFVNVLFRLMGIDAFEVSKINIKSLWNSKFLYRLTKSLRNYLKPKLTEESARTHKKLGIQATEYIESILEEELKVSLKNQVLDRYGRPFLFCVDQRLLNCILYEKEEELNTSKAIANCSVQLLQSLFYPHIAVSHSESFIWSCRFRIRYLIRL